MDTQTGILGALNPTVGTGRVDKLLPLLVTLAWLGLGAGLMFKVVPDVQFGTHVWGILGPFVGGFLKAQAPPTPSSPAPPSTPSPDA